MDRRTHTNSYHPTRVILYPDAAKENLVQFMIENLPDICNRRRQATFLNLAALVLLLPALSTAKTLGAGDIGGAIRDESGGVVAGAKVVLTEKSKRLVHTAETDNSGAF